MNNFFNKIGLKLVLIASALWIIIATFFINVSRVKIYSFGMHVKLYELTEGTNLKIFGSYEYLIWTIIFLVIGLAIAQIILALLNVSDKLLVWIGVVAQAINVLVFAAITPIINLFTVGQIKENMKRIPDAFDFTSNDAVNGLIYSLKFKPDWGVYLVISFSLLTIMYLVSYYTAKFKNSNDAPIAIELSKETPKKTASKSTSKKPTTRKATTAKTNAAKKTASKVGASKTSAVKKSSAKSSKKSSDKQ